MQNTEAVLQTQLTKSKSQQSLSVWKNSRELFDPRITLQLLFIHNQPSIFSLIKVMEMKMMSEITDLFIRHKNPMLA